MLVWNDIETTRQLFGAFLGMALFSGNCTKGQEIVGEEPSNFSAAITVAGSVASLISIGTVCCWIRLTNNTFSFIVFFSAVIASRIICFFMLAGMKSNF